ncbi:MAG: metal-dependent transcriptional regulator [Clostridiales bacterium]|jgi:DtxR family Mn-dependent transcriptional regulator|nr:metal-dependent transcriptional regulator [Clostridiales bacterium]
MTKSLEDYLETVLLLEQHSGQARVTDIAEKMNVAKSSVHMALHNLEGKGLLLHEKYGLLQLTENGRKIAGEIYHRHTGLKKFFTTILGLDDKTAEDEACAVEHVLSDETIEKMLELANNKS